MEDSSLLHSIGVHFEAACFSLEADNVASVEAGGGDLISLRLANGNCVQIHRSVLAAASGFLRRILPEGPDLDVEVILEAGHDHVNLGRHLRHLLYTGSTQILSSAYSEFKSILKMLCIDEAHVSTSIMVTDQVELIPLKRETKLIACGDLEGDRVVENDEVNEKPEPQLTTVSLNPNGFQPHSRRKKSKAKLIRVQEEDEAKEIESNLPDISEGMLASVEPDLDRSDLLLTDLELQRIQKSNMDFITGCDRKVISRKPESQRPTTRPADKSKKSSSLSFTCDINNCGQFFQTLKAFRTHSQSVHGVKPLACPQPNCQFRAVDNFKLQTHLRGVHKELYPTKLLKCPICNKEFLHNFNLKNHLKNQHEHDTEDRKKLCLLCGIRCLSLRDHMVRVHPEEMRQIFRCQICPKVFKTRSEWRNHSYTHKGFRPYTCQDCPAVFTRLQNRKKHEQRHNHRPGPVLRPADFTDFRQTTGRKVAEKERATAAVAVPVIQPPKCVKDNQIEEDDLQPLAPVSMDESATENLFDFTSLGLEGVVDEGSSSEILPPVNQFLDNDDDQELLLTRERLQAIGVNCAEIIKISFDTEQSLHLLEQDHDDDDVGPDDLHSDAGQL